MFLTRKTGDDVPDTFAVLGDKAEPLVEKSEKSTGRASAVLRMSKPRHSYFLDFGEGLETKCFRSMWLGTATQYALGSLYAVLLYLDIVLLSDYYWGCELDSWNSQCYYGSYPVTGSFQRSAVYVYIVWLMTLLLYGHLILYHGQMSDFFRLPCDPSDATHVAVKVPATTEELHVFNPSGIVLLYRGALKTLARLGLSQRNAAVWETVPVLKSANDGPLYIDHRCSRYVLRNGEFVKAEPTVIGAKIGELVARDGGLTLNRQAQLEALVGPNLIPFSVDPLLTSVVKEFLSFFYLYQFQMYVLYLWFSYQWVGMAGLGVCIAAGVLNIRIVRDGQKKIASLTAVDSTVEVLRGGVWSTCAAGDLVPGDVVRVKGDGWSLPADMLLLRGAVICNESGLTGESMPVRKFSADDAEPEDAYDPHKHSRHTLFAGTEVLQAVAEGPEGAADVTALVTATGIDTGKGDLIAMILFPNKMIFKYDEELPIVFLFLIVYAIVCFIFVITFLSQLGSVPMLLTMITYGLATMTQILNPLLPVTLVAGNAISARRLDKLGVFCVDPKRISIAGKVRLAVFDKTGTITKDGLDFLGVKTCANKTWDALLSPFTVDACDVTVLHGVASCHAVSILGTQHVGLGVEVAMLEATGWELEERPGMLPAVSAPATAGMRVGGERLEVLRRFDFDHTSMTMSVIVRLRDGSIRVYTKGAPEKVGVRCTGASLPADYDGTCAQYALEGCYVLALSTKVLPPGTSVETLKREELERDLTFISLILFRNEIKPDSPDALRMLREGGVRAVMATGDNAQCAEYIARQSGLIAPNARVLLAKKEGDAVAWREPSRPELPPLTTEDVFAALEAEEHAAGYQEGAPAGEGADEDSTGGAPDGRGRTLAIDDDTDVLVEVDGSVRGGRARGPIELALADTKAFAAVREMGVMDRLRPHTRVWARTTPADKVMVLKMHMNDGLVCSMAGDGGNDCGALREAQAGMALSEAEASVVSPFTTNTGSIMSVVDLLREGRAALANSFGACKWLIAYGMFFSVLKLCCFWYGVIMANNIYLLIDLGTLVIAGVMSTGKPQTTLYDSRPTSSLTGPITVASLVGVLLIAVFFFLLQLFLLGSDHGYTKWPATISPSSWWMLADSWECTVIFASSYLPLLACAATFSLGGRYRKPLYTNVTLTVTLAALFAFTSLLLLLPTNPLSRVFHIASEDFNSGPCPSSCFPAGVKMTVHLASKFDYSGECATCPVSPAWLIFQSEGGAPSSPMPFGVRLRVWLLALLECALLFAYEKFGVMGKVHEMLAKRFPRKRVLKL